jgi:hypothetical protein
MYPLGTAMGQYFPPQESNRDHSCIYWETVLNGTTVVDVIKYAKIPLFTNPE